MSTSFKRFIAGAVCPECQQLDKLYIDDAAKQVVCVRCGFRYQAEQPPAAAPKSPATEQPVTWVSRPKD